MRRDGGEVIVCMGRRMDKINHGLEFLGLYCLICFHIYDVDLYSRWGFVYDIYVIFWGEECIIDR